MYRSLLLSPKAQTSLLPQPQKHFPLPAPGTQQADVPTYIQFPLLQISLLGKSQPGRIWSSRKLKQLPWGGRCWSDISLTAFSLSQAPAEIAQAELGCWCWLLSQLPSWGFCWHQNWLYLVLQGPKPFCAVIFLLWIGILQAKKKKINFNLEGVHKSRMLCDRGIDGLEVWPKPEGAQGVTDRNPFHNLQ